MSVHTPSVDHRPLTLTLSLLIAIILAAACAAPNFDASAAPTPTGPSLDVHTTGEGDRIDLSSHVSPDRDELTIDVYSQRGIGSATLTFAHYFPDHLPDQITLNLHLKGLEQFQITTDDQIIIANIPSSGNGDAIQSAAATSNDATQVQSISANNPLWLTVTKMGDADTYFSIVLPSPLFTQDVQSMTLKWVDFYR
ncbi:MAG: hypothetical protein R2911_08865 [Caldilineaceae bacterium]